jgi:hypothetical protein
MVVRIRTLGRLEGGGRGEDWKKLLTSVPEFRLMMRGRAFPWREGYARIPSRRHLCVGLYGRDLRNRDDLSLPRLQRPHVALRGKRTLTYLHSRQARSSHSGRRGALLHRVRLLVALEGPMPSTPNSSQLSAYNNAIGMAPNNLEDEDEARKHKLQRAAT